MIKDRIGMRYIPHDQYDKIVYIPERIIMICSTFENEFRLLFNDKINHKPSSIKKKEKIKSILEDVINNNELKTDEKRKIKKMIDSLDYENYSSKVNEVLKKYPFIEEQVKDIYVKYNKKYNRNNFTTSLEKLRNSIAHYKIDAIITENRIVILMGLERIILSLQLIDCGMEIENINLFVKKLIS